MPQIIRLRVYVCAIAPSTAIASDLVRQFAATRLYSYALWVLCCRSKYIYNCMHASNVAIYEMIIEHPTRRPRRLHQALFTNQVFSN